MHGYQGAEGLVLELLQSDLFEATEQYKQALTLDNVRCIAK